MRFLLAFLLPLICGFQGQNSSKDLIEVPREFNSLQPLYKKLHALIIGVDDYPKMSAHSLKYAVSDAKAVAAELKAEYGFQEADVHVIVNDQATLEGIRRELADIASNKRVGPDDLVLVYFSGHGQTVQRAGSGEMGYLLPSDADVDLNDPTDAGPYQRTCLSMSSVKEALEICPAKHRLLLVDACFSGLLANMKGVGLTKSTIEAHLSRQAAQVITAGGKNEQASERSLLGHGIFTAKLIEELQARYREKEVFTTSSLAEALKNSVSNATDGKQRPQSGNFGTEGEVLFAPGGSFSPASSPKPPKKGGTVKEDSLFATLNISCPVRDVTITIDGVAADSENQIDLTSQQTRTVKVRVEAGGYLPAQYTVTLERGKSTDVEVKLVPVKTQPLIKTGFAAENLNFVREIAKQDKGTFDAAFSPSGKIFAVAGGDGLISIFDLAEGDLVKSLEGDPADLSREPTTPVTALVFSDENTLIVGYEDGTIKIWDLGKSSATRRISGHESHPVDSLTLSANRSLLATSGGGRVQFLSIKSSPIGTRKVLLPNGDGYWSPAFSFDGKYAIDLRITGAVEIRDANSFQLLKAVASPNRMKSTITQCSPVESIAAASLDDGQVRLLGLPAGNILKTLAGHKGKVVSMAFSPDGKTLATGGEDQTFKLWDVKTGAMLRSFEFYSTPTSIQWSPDGKTLLATQSSGGVEMWRVRN